MSESLKLSHTGNSYNGANGGEDSTSSSVAHSSIGQGKHDYQWARFLRELAGVLVLFLNIPDQAWVGLLKKVGLSQVDVEEITTQDLDPEIQVYKLLSKSKQGHKNPIGWWNNFSKEVGTFGKAKLTKAVQSAYDKFITGDLTESVTESVESEKWPPTKQEAVGTSPKAPSSQSFELLDEEEVIRSNEHMKSRLKEEIEVMDPATTQRIDELQRTVLLLSKESNSKLASKLAYFVTDTLQMENSLRATTTLNSILERENEAQKKNIVRLTKESENRSREIDTLKQDNEELKKTKADKQLTEFDVITKREASQAHDEGSTQQNVLATNETNMVSLDAYKELQGRCLKVTSQRDQLVKVNHQWDKEYQMMETALRSEHQSLYENIIGKDEEIMAGKRLVVAMEKEKADCEKKAAVITQELNSVKGKYEPLQAKYDSEKEKCRKFHEYAIRLKGQRDKLEREVSRLNQVLSNEKLVKKVKAEPSKTSDQAPEYEAELSIYRQQAELFEKDFKDEQREKQRLVEELNYAKEELRNLKKKAKKMDAKFQMYQDEQMAQQLQRGAIPEDRHGKRNRSKDQMYQDEQMAQQLQQGLIPEDHYGNRSRPKFQKERLVAHSGVNYAGNDRFVDSGPLSSFGSIEADNNERDDVTNEEEERHSCPGCQRVFMEDGDFFVHLEECLEK